MMKNVTFSSNMVNGQTETNLSSSACPEGQTDLCPVVRGCGLNIWHKTLGLRWTELQVRPPPLQESYQEAFCLPDLWKMLGFLRSQNLKIVQYMIQMSTTSRTLFPSQETWPHCETLEALAVAKAESWSKASRTKVHRPPRGVWKPGKLQCMDEEEQPSKHAIPVWPALLKVNPECLNTGIREKASECKSSCSRPLPS